MQILATEPGNVRTHHYSLGASLTPIGRDRELEELKAFLFSSTNRPLLVCGTPGIGKSTLAGAVLRDPDVERKFSGRRFQVRCDDRNDVADLIIRVASDWFGVTKNNPKKLRSSLLVELGQAPCLLLIDNYETLAFNSDASVRQSARDFLADVASVKTVSLIVGCQTLKKPAELDWMVMTPSPLGLADARSLFLRSLGKPHFAGDPYLNDLLLELDGVPHAIVLIAQVAVGYQSLDVVLELWRSESSALFGVAAGHTREETIAVAYEVSYNALEPTVQRALSSLAVLPAGLREHDANGLIPGRTRAVGALAVAAVCYRVGKASRLALLSPLRSYISANHPAQQSDLRPYLDHFLRLAAGGAKVGITHTRKMVEDLLAEQKNLEWAVESSVPSGCLESIHAAIGLGTFGSHVGLDYSDVLKGAIKTSDPGVGTSVIAECLRTLADLERVRHRHEAAKGHYETAQAKFVQVQDRRGEAWCLWGEADVAVRLDEYASAKPLFEDALAQFRTVSEDRGCAWALRGLGDIELMHDRLENAKQLYTEARGILFEVRDFKGQAWCCRDLAQVARLSNNLGDAISLNTEAIKLFRAAADLGGEGGCFWDMGIVALSAGDLDGAEASFLRGQALFQAAQDEAEAWCLQGLGQVASRRGKYPDARHLYFKAIRQFRALTNRSAEAGAWSSLAKLKQSQGHLQRSRSLYRTALRIYESVHYQKGERTCLEALRAMPE